MMSQAPTAMQRDSAGKTRCRGSCFPWNLEETDSCSDQVLPFHLTAFVALMAVQALAALHETSVKLPPAESFGGTRRFHSRLGPWGIRRSRFRRRQLPRNLRKTRTDISRSVFIAPEGVAAVCWLLEVPFQLRMTAL